MIVPKVQESLQQKKRLRHTSSCMRSISSSVITSAEFPARKRSKVLCPTKVATIATSGADFTERKQSCYHKLIEEAYFRDFEFRTQPVGGILPAPSNPINSTDRDNMVNAMYTIYTCLELSMETWHSFVGLVDRYISVQAVEYEDLEIIAVTCLWIACKFHESQETLDNSGAKECLQSRPQTGNWEWSDIIEQEMDILEALNYRLHTITTSTSLYREVAYRKLDDSPKLHTAHYFLDLASLHHEFRNFNLKDLVDGVLFLSFEVEAFKLNEAEERVKKPAIQLLLTHLKVLEIDPTVADWDPWSSLRCKHARNLSKPWQIPYSSTCSCKICAKGM